MMENTQNEANEANESLEWRSVLDAVVNVDIRATLLGLEQLGVVAYTDGACLKNPGGPAGWSALLWAAVDQVDGKIVTEATCLELYGHIPRSATTTNNRAEISAVLAVLCVAPPTLPLKIYSDSEYTIKVALGEYQMKANPDLWALYRKLLGYRRQPPTFEWVRGHAGQVHNERADELAGMGAFNRDRAAYEKWQASQAPEAHNRSSRPTPVTATTGDLVALRVRVQRLKTLFESIAIDSPRVSQPERKFVEDMARRLQKNNFVPSEKQYNWLKGLVAKHKV
ncbi:MAG TPA: RNase H family protein [Ktedonobacteraceae bacterium]|nr:RNase H family protein [Ktedonobacteraceae bacterium]